MEDHATVESYDSIRPNLFIVGAMKSGTSSLHAILGRHPEIFMCEPKEPCYFMDKLSLKERWPDMYERGYWQGERNYLKLFEAGRGCPTVGESSTYYSKRPRVLGVPERIHDFNPEAKIIYLMRDPVRRTISHYWHRVRKKGEVRGMSAAIREDPYYVEISHYAMQLEPYLRLFGRDQVYALTIEGFDNDLPGEVAKILRWLGVDDSVLPPNLNERAHATSVVVEQQRFFLPRVVGRESFLIRSLRSWLSPAVRERLHRLIYQEVDRRSADLDEVIEYLKPIQLKQVEELASLLGREFQEWQTLYGEAAPMNLKTSSAGERLV